MRDPDEQNFANQQIGVNVARINSITLEQHIQNVIGLFFITSNPVLDRSQDVATNLAISSPTYHDVQHIVRSSIYFRVLLNFCRSLNCVEAVNVTEEDAYLLQIAVMSQAASEQANIVDTNLTAALCISYFIEMGVELEKSKMITQFIYRREKAGLLGDIIEHVWRFGKIRSMKTFKMDDLSLFRMAVANSQSGIFIQIINDVGLLIAKQCELRESSKIFWGEQVVVSLEKTFQQSDNCSVNDNQLTVKQIFDSTLNDIACYLILNHFYNRNQPIVAKKIPTPVVSRGLRTSLPSVATSSLNSTLETDLPDSKKRKNRSSLTTCQQKKNKAVQSKAKASSEEEPLDNKDVIPVDEKSEAYDEGRRRGKIRWQKAEWQPIKCVVPVKYITSEADKANYCAGFQKGMEVALDEFEADLKRMQEEGHQQGLSNAGERYRTLSPEAILRLDFPPLHLPAVSAPHVSGCPTKYLKNLHQVYLNSYSLAYHYEINWLFYATDCFERGFRYGQPVKQVELPYSFFGEFNPEQEATLKQDLLARFQEGTKLKLELTQSHRLEYQFALVEYLINQIKKLPPLQKSKQNWGVLHHLLLRLHPELKDNIAFIFRNHFVNHQWRVLKDNSREYGYDSYEQAEQQLLLIRLCIGKPISNSPNHKPYIPFDTHFTIAKTKAGNGSTRYYFSVTRELYNKINDLLFEDSLAKSIRWDKDNFLEDFILSITKSPQNNHVFALRKGEHKKWTVCANGVFFYKQRPSPYRELTPEQLRRAKSETSKHQSTSFIMSSQHILGFDKEPRGKLVGFIFKINDKLINRCFFYDGATQNRPWEFDTQEQAADYHHTKTTNQTFFKNITELKSAEMRLGVGTTLHYNEVLARLRWDINTSCVGIFSDTFEARCIAIFYAKMLRKRLVAQYQELNKTLPDAYEVPIRYYLPPILTSDGKWNHNSKHGGLYTNYEQQLDKQMAEKIYSDLQQARKRIVSQKAEFILLLDNFESLRIDDIPLFIWFAAAQMEIGLESKLTQLVYNQTSLPKHLPMEEYFIIETEKLLNKWLADPDYKLCMHPLIIAKWLGKCELIPDYMERKINNTKELIAEDRQAIISFGLCYGKEYLGKLISLGLTVKDLFVLADRRGKIFPKYTEILLELGADINAQRPDGATILHLAVADNNLASVEILLRHKPDLEIKDMNGDTPMHIAVSAPIDRTLKEIVAQRNRIILCLIERGASYWTPNDDGLTALDMAKNLGDKEVEAMMEESLTLQLEALKSDILI